MDFSSQVKRSGVCVNARVMCLFQNGAPANDFHAKAISGLVSSGTSFHIGRCYTDACQAIAVP